MPASDHPVLREVIADIRRILSGRYVEDRSSPFGPYVRSESGLRFDELSSVAQRDVLINAPVWGWHDDAGMTQAEQLVIISNVLDGKPQERWFEGLSDTALHREKMAEFKTLLEGSEPTFCLQHEGAGPTKDDLIRELREALEGLVKATPLFLTSGSTYRQALVRAEEAIAMAKDRAREI
jgi:hypothetical protein